MSIATFNTGPDIHLLDHIAPLASLLKAPLIVNDPICEQTAISCYPHVLVQRIDCLEKSLGYLAQHFNTLIECKYWQPHLKLLFETLYQKKMRLIFCPHGQSDKGLKKPLLAPYGFQDAVLLYGPLLKEMLKTLDVPLPAHTTIGNYRLVEYLQNEHFYDELAEQKVFSQFRKQQKILLYAPTWKDLENSTSFFEVLPKLIASLPHHWNLLIKPHPLLKERNPGQFYALAKYFEKTPNLLFLEGFPCIYPLLKKTTAYLGDCSSISYDALYFQIPSFFFEKITRVQQCGFLVDPDNPFSSIQENMQNDVYKRDQKRLYTHAFGSLQSIEEIREKIQNLL